MRVGLRQRQVHAGALALPTDRHLDLERRPRDRRIIPLEMNGRRLPFGDGDLRTGCHVLNVFAGLHQFRRHDVLRGVMGKGAGAAPRRAGAGRARARHADGGKRVVAHPRRHRHGARAGAGERIGQNKGRPGWGRHGGRRHDDLRRHGCDGPGRRQQFQSGMGGRPNFFFLFFGADGASAEGEKQGEGRQPASFLGHGYPSEVPMRFGRGGGHTKCRARNRRQFGARQANRRQTRTGASRSTRTAAASCEMGQTAARAGDGSGPLSGGVVWRRRKRGGPKTNVPSTRAPKPM